jgi:hypothetical protein
MSKTTEASDLVTEFNDVAEGMDQAICTFLKSMS